MKAFTLHYYYFCAFLVCSVSANNGLFLPQIEEAPIYDLQLNPDLLLQWQIDYDQKVVIFEVSYFGGTEKRKSIDDFHGERKSILKYYQVYQS